MRFDLTATVLDCRDPHALGRFWSELLGWPIGRDEDDWVTLRPPGGGAGLSFQPEGLYARPAWPARAGEQQMQMHLDVEVEELGPAVERARSLGATLEEHQPQEDVRVMRDPEGHVFCLWV